MLNLNILKNKKPVRIFAMFLGVVVASITCVNPASADETVSVDGTTLYRDFQVISSGGNYEINALALAGGSTIDPVIHLYRGTSRAGYDFANTTVSGDFLAVDDDGGSGLNAYLSGTIGRGLDNYVIRVSSFAYWASYLLTFPDMDYPTATPTESYTLTYTGFTSGTVKASVRQTHNLSFSKSLYGSDNLSDPTGELRNIVDSINAKWGNLIK